MAANLSGQNQEEHGNTIKEGPGKEAMGLPGILLTSAYLILIAILVIHGLVVLWPPDISRDTRRGGSQAAATPSPPIAAPTTPGLSPGAAISQPAGATTSPTVAATVASPSPTPSPSPTVTPSPTLAAGNQSTGSAPGQTQDRKCEEGQLPSRYLVWSLCLSSEERLFLIVMLAGALGSLVHAFQSLYWYIGNRRLVWSWLAMYVMLPFIGASIALVFYFVIRGGFLSPGSQVEATNPYGFAALGVIIGMFTEEAVLKLKQIAETVLAKSEKGKDHVSPAPTVTRITPNTGPAAGNTPITITGTNFVNGATVTFGGAPATSILVVNSTTITAQTPPHAAGPVNVEVTNPDKQKGVLANGYTYTP